MCQQKRRSQHLPLLPPGPNLVAENSKFEDRTWSKHQGDGIGLNSNSMISCSPCPGREPGWITPSDRQLCAPAGGSAYLHPPTGHRGKWWSASWWQPCGGDECRGAGGCGLAAPHSSVMQRKRVMRLRPLSCPPTPAVLSSSSLQL